MDANKLSPLSPSYPTSDLGSSPRSSISISHPSMLLGPNWTAFRNYKTASSDYDAESDICGKEGFLSPGTALSPAPFSPFSDCVDPHTPYSDRSPNLSPVPMPYSRFRYITDFRLLYQKFLVLTKSVAVVPCQTEDWKHKNKFGT